MEYYSAPEVWLNRGYSLYKHRRRSKGSRGQSPPPPHPAPFDEIHHNGESSLTQNTAHKQARKNT